MTANENKALLELRNMILTSFAEQLKTQCISTPDTAHLRYTVVADVVLKRTLPALPSFYRYS